MDSLNPYPSTVYENSHNCGVPSEGLSYFWVHIWGPILGNYQIIKPLTLIPLFPEALHNS